MCRVYAPLPTHLLEQRQQVLLGEQLWHPSNKQPEQGLICCAVARRCFALRQLWLLHGQHAGRQGVGEQLWARGDTQTWVQCCAGVAGAGACWCSRSGPHARHSTIVNRASAVITLLLPEIEWHPNTLNGPAGLPDSSHSLCAALSAACTPRLPALCSWTDLLHPAPSLLHLC